MLSDDTLDAARLAILDAYRILDTGAEDCFDRVLALAGALCGTPLAALAFVDATREWRKATLGAMPAEVARGASLAAQVVATRCELVLPDTHDGRYAAARAAGWRFYAAMPLVTQEGYVLGVLAVMDRAPRLLAAGQLDGLRTLAQLAMAQLELRRRRHDETPAAAEPEQRLRQLADAMPYVVWSATPEGLIDYANKAIYDYAGMPDTGDIGAQWIGLLHPEDVEPTLAVWGESVATGAVFSAEYRLLRGADRAYRWHLAKGMPIRSEEGAIVKWYGTTTDIHDMKLAHEEIGRLAFYDTLTGLPNRQLLADRLGHAVALHARNKGYGAVLLIDLDHFKLINDTLGHDRGDLLLELVARKLVASVAARDTVSRLGGDEFVIVLEDIGLNEAQAAGRAAGVARRILEALSGSFNLDGYERHITPSVGVALFGGVVHGIGELLKRADMAMYQAKGAGRNTVRFFDPAVQAAALARASLDAELRQALQDGQFLLHYQPQQDGAGTVIGLEALVRWQHPQRGMVSPAEFIPLAEDTGLILPLGRWVLEEACAQLVRLGAVAGTAGMNLSVNVSALQFRQRGFVDEVLEVLARTGADPRRLKIELTESLLVEDMDGAIEKMARLKEHGVCFALDDFGTGYSSLAYLKRLPLDELKIDQSFVRNLHSDSRDLAIVHTIVALGRSLSMSVIAEGVETTEQRAQLAECGCHHYQGYLFSRPLPAQQLAEFLARRT